MDKCRETLLVTGSSGRIGAAICTAATARYSVTGLDRTPGPHTDEIRDLAQEGFDLPTGAVDVVIHAAGLHAPHVGKIDEETFHLVNVSATERLALAARAAGVRHFVFTSTTALYGVRSETAAPAQWIDEETSPRPRTIYHRTKLEAETRLRRLAGPDFRVSILRLGRCFPEPVDLMAVYRLHRGIDQRDAAAAHLAAPDRGGDACETFIISATTPFQKQDCTELARNAPDVIARRCPALVRAFRERGWTLPGSIDRVYDNARARTRLGWVPMHDCMSVIQASELGGTPGTK